MTYMQVIRVHRAIPNFQVDITAGGPMLRPEAHEMVEALCSDVADLAITMIKGRLTIEMLKKKGNDDAS